MSLVHFEIEEDAVEIFRDYVIKNPAPNKMLEFPADPPPQKKKQVSLDFEIDLHGMTLEEAIDAVDRLIRKRIAAAKGIIQGKIITGKGRNSQTKEGVLARHVHRYVENTFAKHIVFIEESPADVNVGGLAIRGHFVVRLRK